MLRLRSDGWAAFTPDTGRESDRLAMRALLAGRRAAAGGADAATGPVGPAGAGPAEAGPAGAGPAEAGPAGAGPAEAGPAGAGPAGIDSGGSDSSDSEIPGAGDAGPGPEPECIAALIETGAMLEGSAGDARDFAARLSCCERFRHLAPHQALWVYIAARSMGVPIDELGEDIAALAQSADVTREIEAWIS